MKATLTDEPPAGPGWIYETKWDGIRCFATKRDGRVELRSRNGLPLDDRFAPIAEALAGDPAEDFVLDGEAALFDAEGVSRFGGGGGTLAYVVFDVLRADGEDLRGLPLLERKERLRALLRFGEPIRFSEHFTGDGAALLAQACADGLEGLIAKRAGSPYVERRTKDWLKLKCSHEQELVVGGFTPPKGARSELGALLVGHFKGDELRYAGKVGSGFSRATLADMARRLAPLRRDTTAFADAPRFRAVTWVEPEVVVQVAFTEWTRDGRLRHPRFVGVREDRPARDVVREHPS